MPGLHVVAFKLVNVLPKAGQFPAAWESLQYLQFLILRGFLRGSAWRVRVLFPWTR